MDTRSDVVIVGAGVMGTAIAFNLARLGCRRVTVFEQYAVGAGATGKSVGVLRTHYSHRPTVEMALKSLDVFERFTSVVGGDAGLRQVGWLQIASARERDVLRQHLGVLRGLGVETDLLDAVAIRRRCPGVEITDTAIAAWEPRSGYADPHSVNHAYGQAAQALGVEIQQGVRVARIVTGNGRVQGVETSRGTVAADVVVITTAAWTNPLLAPLGLEVPLRLSRHQVIVLKQPPQAPPIPSVVKDLDHKTYLKPEAGDLLVVGTVDFHFDPVDPEACSEMLDPDYMGDVSEKVSARFPALRDAGLLRGWTGVYDITPDWNPLLGALPGVGGLYCAVGFNGHGFKLAPATGICMAELIVFGRASLVDIHPFRPQRFQEGEQLVGVYGPGSSA